MFCSSPRTYAVLAAACLAFFVAALLFGRAAEARSFRFKQEKINPDGTITAWSQDGDRGVRTPVRRDRFGALEVYVPNWGWEPCGPTCAYTVQKYGLDFWEAQSDDLGVGYLSFELSR